MVTVLNWLGCGLLGMGLVYLFANRIQLQRACYALGGVSFYIGDALAHDALGQIWQAAYTAFWAWQWWKGGGGDGTKRRLKKWARKFTPMRRTAPQLT
jgi:hypothetical protein